MTTYIVGSRYWILPDKPVNEDQSVHSVNEEGTPDE